MPESAALIAHQLGKAIYQIKEDAFTFTPIFKTERFHLYKVGSTLIISHGVGMPSMMICLNEVTKLLIHTGNTDAEFLKVGPCGGLGIEPGTIVISKSAVNSKLEALQHTIECGEEYVYSTVLDEHLADELIEFNNKYTKFSLIAGKAIGAWDFYEEQGRMDGFLPLEYSLEERDLYFSQAENAGVKCIDMESLEFAAFCNHIGITASIVNAVIVDRFKSDEVNTAHAGHQVLAINLVTRYVAHKLNPSLLSR